MKKIFIIFLIIFIFPSFAYSLVQISNMNDFSFGTWSGSGQLQSTDNICIHDTQVNPRYGITASGSGAGSAFTIQSGANTIAYTAEWQGSVTAITTLIPAVKSQFQDANRVSATCGGGTNASLRITISQANLEAANAGTYTGTLTILLTRN